jgi:hypothetical protein
MENMKSGSKKTYLDDVILDHLKKGSPPIHSKLPNWGADGCNPLINGHAHKDEFKKANRVTTAAQIFEEAKKRKIPALG